MISVLITGAFGQVGTSLGRFMNQDYDLTLTGRNIPSSKKGIILDIRNTIAMKEIIDVVQPDVIINLAAITSVDRCETEPEYAIQINTQSVKNICSLFSGRIIYLSTDYVFDGKNGPYSENDIAKPINKYGATKLESEKLILENNPGSLVIRSNVVYDYNLNTQASFLNWVIQSLQNNLEIQVVNDQINNPTWSESLAQTIVLSIEKHISGIAHWGGADYLNRYDFAVKIAKKFSLNSNLIKPIETEELNQPAKRPLNSGLKTSYLSKKLGISPLTIDECLETILKRVLQ